MNKIFDKYLKLVFWQTPGGRVAISQKDKLLQAANRRRKSVAEVSKVDGSVPRTQRFNLGIVRQFDESLLRRTAGANSSLRHPSSSSLVLSSLELSDTKVYEPSIRARLGTASHFCEAVVLRSRSVPTCTTLSRRILRVIRCGAQTMYKRR